MSEKLPQQPDKILEQQSEIPTEMPEDFVEPEGRSDKWGEVVENKELGVRYREKVIELPKSRQEETGIKRIRRRELLPPFPADLYDDSGYHEIELSTGIRKIPQPSFLWKSGEKTDSIYHFLTDDGYPSAGTAVHGVNYRENSYVGEKAHSGSEEFKKKGLYFQKISSPEFWFNGMRMFNNVYNTPVFVFGNKNKMFNEYADSMLSSPDVSSNDKIHIGWVRKRNPNLQGGEFQIFSFGRKKIKAEPLRWCHAELALVPTKRSLNVLFFETEDESEEKE